jgi:hypothetical protein
MQPALDPRIQTIQVRQNGLVGTLFQPPTPPPWPTVVSVGGSSPRIFGLPGLPFAGEGIATLALAYFGMPGLPRTFSRGSRIPRWLPPRRFRSSGSTVRCC